MDTLRSNYSSASFPLSIAATVLLFLLVTSPGHASAAESTAAAGDTITEYDLAHGWFSRDKSYHLAASAVGAAGLYTLGRELGLGRNSSVVAASLLMVTLGVLRETYDVQDPRYFSNAAFSKKDMFWNLAGITIGITVTEAIAGGRWRIDHHSRRK